MLPVQSFSNSYSQRQNRRDQDQVAIDEKSSEWNLNFQGSQSEMTEAHKNHKRKERYLPVTIRDRAKKSEMAGYRASACEAVNILQSHESKENIKPC